KRVVDWRGDVCDRSSVRRCQGPRLHRRVPRGLHLRRRAITVHPPGRVRGLRRLRAGVPGRGDLLRGRPARGVGGLLQGERRVLRRGRLPRWRRQGRRHPPRSPDHRRPPAPGRVMGVRDLADYPWDAVEPYRERAAQHPGGLVDLSVGSPVDPTPEVIRRALAEATDAHAYPQTVGTPALREVIVDWYARRRGVPDLTVANVLPTIGSKEIGRAHV